MRAHLLDPRLCRARLSLGEWSGSRGSRGGKSRGAAGPDLEAVNATWLALYDRHDQPSDGGGGGASAAENHSSPATTTRPPPPRARRDHLRRASRDHSLVHWKWLEHRPGSTARPCQPPYKAPLAGPDTSGQRA